MGALASMQVQGPPSCQLLFERLVTLGCSLSKLGPALGKLTLQIGYELLGIGHRALGRRAHLRTSSGSTFWVDHTVIDKGYHRLSIETIRAGERPLSTPSCRPSGPRRCKPLEPTSRALFEPGQECDRYGAETEVDEDVFTSYNYLVG